MAKATASTTAFGNASLAAAQKHSSAFTSVGIAGVAIAGGLGFAMKAAADAAISFESTFAGVRKTVDATEAEFEVMAQGIRDMAKEIPVGVEELNRIAESAGQLGIAKEGILEFTHVVADLGATTTLTSDEASNALARIANIMGTSSDDFDRLGSTIVALGNAGAATEPEIVDFALRIAGAGKVAGMAEADVLSLASSFLDVGIPAEAGGTAVQKAILGITTAVATGGEKLETFAETAGLSAAEFSAAWRADPAQAFLAFIEGLGQQGQQGIVTLQELFGVNERVARSFLSVASSGDMARTSVALGSDAWAENSALAEEAGKRYETTASKVAIAGNKINDAAISFGALMLPAIAAVVGALGDFADLIGGLPGPVRAVVLVVGFAAAAMALLAGATFLLLPRLAQVKAAMVDAGISAGFFKGSLSMAARAINPWTLGVTAIIAGLTIWAQKTAEQKGQVDDLTASLDKQTSAITEGTRAIVAHRFEEEGILEAAQSLGISLELITDAALDEAGAMEELQSQLTALAPNFDLLEGGVTDTERAIVAVRGGVSGLSSDLTEAIAKGKREAEALGGVEEGAEGAGGAAGGATGPIEDLGEGMKDAATKAERLTDALEELAGIEMTVEETNLAWLNSLAGLSEELKHGAKTLNDNTQAGRDNRAALLDSIDAAFDRGAAEADATGSVKKGAEATAKMIEQLIDEAEKAGISEEAIHDYIAELNLTPKNIRTIIELRGAETVSSQLATIAGQILALPSAVLIGMGLGGGGVSGPTDHAGGTIGASGPRRLHAGGNLRADEELVIGQRGERMLSAREWHALRSITGTGAAAPHASRSSDSGGRIVKVFVRADRRHFTEELDHDVTYAGRWAS